MPPSLEVDITSVNVAAGFGACTHLMIAHPPLQRAIIDHRSIVIAALLYVLQPSHQLGLQFVLHLGVRPAICSKNLIERFTDVY